VTRPPNSETDSRVTDAVLHVAPLAVEEPNATTGAAAGYAEGPRAEAGVPSASTRLPGTTIAAAPAPTQVWGRKVGESRAYAGVGPAVVVVPFVPSA
jgi:hypothetical protein